MRSARILPFLSLLLLGAGALPSKDYRRKVYSFLLNVLTDKIPQPSPEKHSTRKGNEISVLSWNILAPIRVDLNALSGLADPNLFDSDLRISVISKRILELDADIVNLQEIQVDTYATIAENLREVYDAAPFAYHGLQHWLDLPPGVKNVKNGVATFFRKTKFRMWRSEQSLTSDNGNTAQSTLLKMYQSPGRRQLSDPLVLMVNCHLHHGFGLNDSALRVAQSTNVTQRITKITEDLRRVTSLEPTVLLAGDFNSIKIAPTIQNIRSRGYVDSRDVVNNTQSSIYYPELVFTEFLPPFDGLPLDTIFAPKPQVDSGKTTFTSVVIPDIASEQYSETSYVTYVLKLIEEELEKGRIDRKKASSYLAKLQSSLSDGNAYDSKYNRAIRIGSDHVPVLVEVRIKALSNGTLQQQE